MEIVEPTVEGVPADVHDLTAPNEAEAAEATGDQAAPRAIPTEESAENDPRPPLRSPRPAPRHERASVVLIVDPDAVSRRFVEIAFGRRGDLRLQTALDGAGALEVMAAEPVHLIISETDFGDMSGLQLLHRLGKDGRLRGVPFLFLSADARATAKIAAFAAGADDFLTKPCDGEVLSTRVRALIARERRAAAERQTAGYGLAGTFAELAAPDLMSLLEHGRRSGTVSVACDDALGTLFLDEGQVVHGVFGNLVGPAAFSAVMARTEGQFEFTPGACPITPPRWTIIAGAVRMPGARSVTAKYFAPLLEEPTIVVGLPASVAVPSPTGRPDGVSPRTPAYVPDPGSATQIEHAILDGFSLGDLTSFTEKDLETWTAATPVRERFHVILAADLAHGASAMLALAGSPTEDWILRNLGAPIAAFALEFHLRRARVLDVLLVDLREPMRLCDSLRRVPSVVIVAPPAGDPLGLGVRSRIEIVDFVSRLAPPAVLVLGNPSLKKAFRTPGTETAIRCLPSALGEPGTDLRAVRAEGIRLCAGTPR